MPFDRRKFLAMSGAMTTGLLLQGVGPAAAASPHQARLGRSGQVGYTDHDLIPADSSLSHFGDHVRYAADFDYRSIGIDFGRPMMVNAVELTSMTAANGLTSRDWTVYVSPDNRRWTKSPQVRLVNLGGSIWLLIDAVSTRFLKAHCHREVNDAAASTFILDDLQSFTVHHLEIPALIAGQGSVWSFRTEIQVKNSIGSALRDRAAYLSFDALDLAALIEAGIMTDDLRDLRFADEAGRYLHAYADAGGVWVRIDHLPGHATQSIFMYSGNAAATDVVHRDAAALQVEYGQRTLTRFSTSDGAGGIWGDDVRAVALPTGVVMVAAGGVGSGLGARFSDDGGRTFSDVSLLVPRHDAATRFESAGSFFVDPESGSLLCFYYTLGARSGSDWLDETQFSCQCWLARADSYDANGRPIFTSFQRLTPISRYANRPAAWALTYTNPIRTKSGALLVPIAYAQKNDGTFAVSVFRSTDNGLSWEQNAQELQVPGNGFEVGISETAIASLKDGSVLIQARQQGAGRYYQATTRSTDDGLTWAEITDSVVLSSNTFPAMSRDREDALVLSWSGHNARGMASYYRNNLTVAYSDDEARTWNGYHDVIGATTLSVPGFGGSIYDRVVVQGDSTPVGDHDRVFSWYSWSAPPRTPYVMLMEDFEDYVHRSHGALDVVEFRDSNRAPLGAELTFSRWWRTSSVGSLDLVPGRRAAGKAIRLKGSVSQLVAASRIFPALRKGIVRFSVNWKHAAAGLHLCLQEGYSGDINARGTVASLLIDPSGRLLATTDDTFETVRIGYLNQDVDPATGNLANLGATGLFGFDYRQRSIGIDFTKPTTIDSVTVVDNDSTTAGRPGTRIVASDLQVWASDENQGDWRRLSDWGSAGADGTFTLSGQSATTRFLKVTQPYTDDAFTFVNDFSKILRFNPPQNGGQSFPELPNPAAIPANTWATIELDVDTASRTVKVAVDGVPHGQLDQVHAAEVVTHLLIENAPGANPTEIAVDELIVQDRSMGLPTLSAVGKPKRFASDRE